VSGYSGDAGDAMAAASAGPWNANGMMFTTPDSDNDIYANGNCATFYENSWWFGVCGTSHITRDSNAIWTTGSAVFDVQFSRMLVRLY